MKERWRQTGPEVPRVSAWEAISSFHCIHNFKPTSNCKSNTNVELYTNLYTVVVRIIGTSCKYDKKKCCENKSALFILWSFYKKYIYFVTLYYIQQSKMSDWTITVISLDCKTKTQHNLFWHVKSSYFSCQHLTIC